jgi:NAD(P)-dependent dehydrogenase (short-subunit alcohol dehydrogenase family)
LSQAVESMAGTKESVHAMNDLSGQVILLAGAMGALGIGLAEGFRSKGATVLIAPGGPCSPELVAACPGSLLRVGEVSDPVSLALRCDEIKVRHGRLDLIIFCSGTERLPQVSEEDPIRAEPSKLVDLLEQWGARLRALANSVLDRSGSYSTKTR